MKLIATQTLATAQPSITFSAIPQNFTDLYILVSARSSLNSNGNIALLPNGATTNQSGRFLYGNGAVTGSAVTATNGEYNIVTYIGDSDQTANTFGNASFYITNYAGSTAKSFSIDSVNENNGTNAAQAITASLWNNTAAITNFILHPVNGGNLLPQGSFAAGTSVSLYGIGGPGSIAAKAVGGTVSRVGAYWVHTFTSSGTFSPLANLTDVEYLVVAGGGGASSWFGSSGGGAGGYRSSVVGESSGGGASAETRLSLSAGVAQTVTVGAGGTGGTSTSSGSSGVQGTNSSFGSITSTGGGFGGNPDVSGGTGGSGGGGGHADRPGGAGTTNQGFAGGAGETDGATFSNGGAGGGAGQAGAAATASVSGKGGDGLNSSITGSTVARAGGGGGGRQAGTLASTPLGGTQGVSSGQGTNGAANTGAGAGGGNAAVIGAAGGSGIVIVRYLA